LREILTYYETINLDELVKRQKTFFSVIPAKAGIQLFQRVLDSRLRGSDGFGTFYEFVKSELENRKSKILWN